MSKWTDERVANLRQHWGAGMKIAHIAALFGVSSDAIKRAAARHGFPPHPNSNEARQLSPEAVRENRKRGQAAWNQKRKERLTSDPEYAAHRKAITHAWYVANREHQREVQAAWRARNRQKIRDQRRAQPKAGRKGGAPLIPYKPKPEAVPDTAVTFMELGSHHCHWVIGEPNGMETIYCGATVHDRSLCLHHYRLAYIPTPYRRNEAA